VENKLEQDFLVRSRACRLVGERSDLVKQLEKEGKLISPKYFCATKGGYCSDDDVCVALVSRAQLPTRYGEFEIAVFQNNKDGKEHLAVIRGDVREACEVPVRVHSQCQTGDLFGSLRCDCREQLEHALLTFGKLNQAVLLYLKQEGRGIGIANKIRAYELQEQGYDTVEANLALGMPDDSRDYRIGAAMLKLLNVASIVLFTNNPQKIKGLENNGVKVVRREPIIVPANPHNVNYLQTKKEKSGHLID
jgi:GTP cyclohydrolase II